MCPCVHVVHVITAEIAAKLKELVDQLGELREKRQAQEAEIASIDNVALQVSDALVGFCINQLRPVQAGSDWFRAAFIVGQTSVSDQVSELDYSKFWKRWEHEN